MLAIILYASLCEVSIKRKNEYLVLYIVLQYEISGRILRLNKVVGQPFKEKQTSITLGFCSHYVDSTTYHIVLCRLWRTTCVRPKPIPIQVWKALRSVTSNRPDPKRCPCRRISSKGVSIRFFLHPSFQVSKGG
jgi:hypothetical protein